MTIGIWVLGNQLWTKQAALASCEHSKGQTPVILVESYHYGRQRPYHRQKLVLVWSAMRHFAEELTSEGWPVTYEIADDFEGPLRKWIQNNGMTEVRIMSPSDRPFVQLINHLQLGCPVHFISNNQFLWTATEFEQWARSRKRLLLEDFYRAGRKRFGILMNGDQPIGGRWNFDQQNRQPPKGQLKTPPTLGFKPDDMTQSVIHKVQSQSCSSVCQSLRSSQLFSFLRSRVTKEGYSLPAL